MHLVLDILQAAGLGAACGISPLLAVIVAGGLAHAHLGTLGVHLGGTSWAFLQDAWFLLVVAAVLVVVALTRNWWVGTRGDALATAGVVLGVLEGAGWTDGHGKSAAVGGILAGVCAIIAAVATRDLLGRVRARLDAQAAGALPLYAYGIAVVVAGLAVVAPPSSIIVVGFLIWLLIGGRRRSQEKYAGLRSLR